MPCVCVCMRFFAWVFFVCVRAGNMRSKRKHPTGVPSMERLARGGDDEMLALCWEDDSSGRSLASRVEREMT